MNGTDFARAALLGVALAAAGASVNAAETIDFQSGNGTIGSTDSKITYFTSGDGAIGPFSAADFTAAQTGTAAHIVTHYPAWIAGLAAAPTAQWIATSAADAAQSALYAYSFTVTSAAVTSASISLNYAVDNQLGQPGSPGVAGLYLNGVALPGSNGIGDFLAQYSYTDSNITALVHPGVNTLYFYQYDVGVVAGSIFAGSIVIDAVPEPGTYSLFIGGLGCLAAMAGVHRRRRDRRVGFER